MASHGVADLELFIGPSGKRPAVDTFDADLQDAIVQTRRRSNRSGAVPARRKSRRKVRYWPWVKSNSLGHRHGRKSHDNSVADGFLDVCDFKIVKARHGAPPSDALEIVKGFKTVAAAPLRLAGGRAELAQCVPDVAAAIGAAFWFAFLADGRGDAVFFQLRRACPFRSSSQWSTGGTESAVSGSSFSIPRSRSAVSMSKLIIGGRRAAGIGGGDRTTFSVSPS